MKKSIIFIIVAVVLVLVLSTVGIILMNSGSESSGSSGLNFVDNEKQKYADFEAEIACMFIGIDESANMFQVLSQVVDLTAEYGYTEQELTDNIAKYRNDTEFQQMAFDSMQNQCPEKLQAAGVNEYTPRQ